MPGAFAKSLKARGAGGIRMLFQHDPASPIGIWEEIRDSLPPDHELKEADAELIRQNIEARRQVEGFLKEIERRLGYKSWQPIVKR